MRGAVLLLAVFGAALVLSSGAALAQEESLPDLTVEKTGPSMATPGIGESVPYYIDVLNVGSGDAVLPSGAVLVRDVVRSRAGKFQGLGYVNVITTEGVTGLSDGLHNELVPGGPRTKVQIDLVNPPWESSDAIISPGGAIRGASIFVQTKASGGYIINCATVDPDNIIVESDESNNTVCVTTKILP